MAETVEGLVTEAGVDVTGLDRGLTESIALLTRFANTVAQIRPSLNIDTSKAAGSVKDLGSVVDRFLAEVRDVSAVPFLDTASARTELLELINEFPGLTAAIAKIDPTGILRNTAQQAEAATQAILKAQTAAKPITTAGPQPPTPPLTLLASQGDTQLAQNAAENAAAMAHLDQALAKASTDTVALSADTRAAVEVQLRFAAAAEQATTGLSAQTRAAASAAAATAAAASAGAGPLASSALGAAAATNTLAAAETRAEAGTRSWSAGLAIAQRQLATLAAAERAAATGAGRITTGFAGASAQRSQLDALTVSVGRGTAAFGNHVEGAHRAANALAALAATSIHAEGPVARLAEFGLLFGAGLKGVVAGAAGLLVAVTIFDAITEQSRKAKEEIDGAIASLLKLQEAQRSPVRVATDEAGLAAGRVDELRIKIEKLLAAQREIESHPLVFSDRGGDQTAARLVFINGELVKLGREFALAATAASTGGLHVATTQATELAAAIRLGTASIADFSAASAQIQHFNDLAADGTQDLAVQNDAREKANALIDAAQTPLLRQLALQQRLTNETVAAIVATDGIAKAQAEVASGGDFGRLIASYRALEVVAAGDTAQLQQLADKRHEIEKLADAADAAIRAFANIGGAAKQLPILQFRTTFDFTPVGKALLDTLTGQSDAIIGGFLTKLLHELETRSRAAIFAGTITALRRPVLAIEPDGGATAEAERGVEDLNARLLQTNEHWRAATDAAERHRRKIDDNVTAAQRLVNTLSDVARVTNGIDEVASAFGDIGQAAQQGLKGVNELFDSVTAFAEGDILGGIVSGVAGLANLGQALFGESPLQRERNAILERNTAALEHLTTVADRQGKDITGFQVAQAIAAAAAIQERAIGPKRTNFTDAAEFNREVRSAIASSGLDITDLETIAKQHGIELLDSRGALIPGAIQQFNDAIANGTISIADLAQAANEAAGALLNLPDVFKVDVARAIVQRAEPNPLTLTGPAAGTTNANINPATVSTSGTSITTSIGVLNIIVQEAKDAKTTAKMVREEFDKEAMRNSGDVDAWRPNTSLGF